MCKFTAGVRLDLNLEKGRLREDSAGQVLKIWKVDMRIEQEIAGLQMATQASKVVSTPSGSYAKLICSMRLRLFNTLLESVSHLIIFSCISFIVLLVTTCLRNSVLDRGVLLLWSPCNCRDSDRSSCCPGITYLLLGIPNVTCLYMHAE